MTPTDHKAVLRALAAEDGCQASLKAAAHIEYIERQLVSSRDYAENLRRKLAKARHQRNALAIVAGQPDSDSLTLRGDK